MQKLYNSSSSSNNNNNNNKNNNKIQKLSSLSDFCRYPFLILRSLSPASVIWSTHLPLSLSPPSPLLPVTVQLLVALLLQMFSPAVGKSKYSHALSKVSFLWPQTPRQLASRSEFRGTWGRGSLKPTKPELPCENRDEWGPCPRAVACAGFCGLKLCAFQCAKFFGWSYTSP
jgi:hypothetical protein